MQAHILLCAECAVTKSEGVRQILSGGKVVQLPDNSPTTMINVQSGQYDDTGDDDGDD